MPQHAARRLTLVEMLVATALGMILTGVVVFVWIQSSRIFTVTVNRLETYQRLRNVLDTIERDLANTARTVDMEFYRDAGDPANGHYDEGDELFTVGGGAPFRQPYDPLDPLLGESEFALDGFAAAVPYLHAPTILSPEPYTIDAGYTDGRAYWRDEIYVRTFASVQGVNIPALVHYRLVQREDGRSALRRRVWFLDAEGELQQPAGDDRSEATDLTSLVSSDMADLKVGFYFKRSPLSGPEGVWYQVGAIGGDYADERANALLQRDVDRGFHNATAPLDAVPPPLSQVHAGPSGQFNGLNAVSFFYDGNAKIELAQGESPVLRALDRLGDPATQLLTGPTDLSHYSNFGFPGVRPGDKFYLYDAIDDDPNQVTGAPADGTAGPFFPGQVLTVDTISTDETRTWVGVRFREPINFYRLVSAWLGPNADDEPYEVRRSDVTGPSPQYPKAGPPRTINASFNVRYRVGFLPAAFTVRLSSDDRYNKRILPMERVIRLLQQ